MEKGKRLHRQQDREEGIKKTGAGIQTEREAEIKWEKVTGHREGKIHTVYREQREDLKTGDREPDREMEIAGNSGLCRKKRKELISRDRELDREGRRKAKIAVGDRAES